MSKRLFLGCVDPAPPGREIRDTHTQNYGKNKRAEDVDILCLKNLFPNIAVPYFFKIWHMSVFTKPRLVMPVCDLCRCLWWHIFLYILRSVDLWIKGSVKSHAFLLRRCDASSPPPSGTSHAELLKDH